MRYSTGEDVRLWDRVDAWVGNKGVVVSSIDANEFSAEFPRADWSYLKAGVMIDTERAGLVHLAEPDEDSVLLRRGQRPPPEEWAMLRRAQFGRSDSEWKNGDGSTVQIGYLNSNGQICTGHRGKAGTDHVDSYDHGTPVSQKHSTPGPCLA